MKNKRQIIFYVFLVISLISLGLAWRTLKRLKPYSENIYLSMSNQTMTKNEIDKIRSDNRKSKQSYDLLFIANQDEMVSNSSLYKEVNSNLIALSGDKRLFGNHPLTLDSDDLEGCLLSKSLAYQLFGSYRVTNKRVKIKGQDFVVRALLSDQVKDDLAIINFPKKATFIPDMLIIKNDGQTISDTVIINNLKISYGITGQILPFKTLNIFLEILLLVLSLLISLILSSLCSRQIKNWFFKKNAKFIFLGVVLIWGCFAIKTLKIPLDFIPNTSWSDFSFFEKNFEIQIDAIKAFIKIRKGTLELIYVYQIGKLLCLIFIGITALLLSKIWEHDTRKHDCRECRLKS
jgi:hypothetical protein